MSIYFAAGWFFGPGPTRVSVHEGGICIGLLCLSWREVVGWSWDRRGLCVWTTSRWRLCYQLRPQRPIRTRAARDGDLEALLRKYATQAERAPAATL